MYIMSSVTRAWRARRARNRIRSQLRGLDDHLLRDIGIRRDEIDHYADATRYDPTLARMH